MAGEVLMLPICPTDLKQVILCGIETQACVQQTALDLMEDNYDVHVIADAVSSRSMVDRSDPGGGGGQGAGGGGGGATDSAGDVGG